MNEKEAWEQAINSVQHSGLAPEQVLEAVKAFQSTHTNLALTQNEFLLLKRIFWELNDNVWQNWTGTEVNLTLTMPERMDLKSVMRKLWFINKKLEQPGTEGTA